MVRYDKRSSIRKVVQIVVTNFARIVQYTLLPILRQWEQRGVRASLARSSIALLSCAYFVSASWRCSREHRGKVAYRGGIRKEINDICYDTIGSNEPPQIIPRLFPPTSAVSAAG